MNPYLFAADALPQINRYLENCGNIQQLDYITIYYMQLFAFVTKPMFILHKQKMKTLMDRINVKTEMKKFLNVGFVRLVIFTSCELHAPNNNWPYLCRWS